LWTQRPATKRGGGKKQKEKKVGSTNPGEGCREVRKEDHADKAGKQAPRLVLGQTRKPSPPYPRFAHVGSARQEGEKTTEGDPLKKGKLLQWPEKEKRKFQVFSHSPMYRGQAGVS